MLCPCLLLTFRQLVLFTGRKYETIPSHINTVSPLYRAICDLFKDEKSSLKDYAIAVTDSSHPLTRAQPERQWSAETNRFDVQTDDTDGKKEQEEYGAVIYPDNIEVPFSLSLESMAELEQFCAALPVKALDTPDDRPNGHARDHIDVFVCVRTRPRTASFCVILADGNLCPSSDTRGQGLPVW